MADASKVRSNYVAGLQNAAKLVLELNTVLDELSLLYNGSGLSGTFSDQELAADTTTQHLTAEDIGTYTSNLQSINTSFSDPILQNMADAMGKPVGT